MDNMYATDNSRLNELNFDVLEVIFKDLPLPNLVSVCQTSLHAARAIAERIIQHHHLDFDYLNQFWATETIFELFGTNMRSIKIGEQNIEPCAGTNAFDELLRLIVEYAESPDHPSKLRELMMRCNVPLNWNPTTFQHTRDYFENLQRIDVGLVDKFTSSNYDLFLDVLTRKAKRLEAITLRDMNVDGNWLDNLRDVKEIRLFHATFGRSAFLRFLEKQPSLRTFERHHDAEDEAIIQAISEYCPNIETLIDEHQYGAEDEMISGRYACLARLKYLKHVALTSHSPTGFDIADILAVFCQINTIQTLMVKVARDETLLECARPNINFKRQSSMFTQLRSFNLNTFTGFTQSSYFYCEFLAPLQNLEHLIIENSFLRHRDLYDLSLCNTRVSLININGSDLIDDTYYTIAHVSKTRKSRSTNIAEGKTIEPLHFILNLEQFEEMGGRKLYKTVQITLNKQ